MSVPKKRMGMFSEKSNQADFFGDPAGNDLLFFEKALWNRGHLFVAGLDDAGRGPLAGPVFAAAVVLPRDVSLPGVNDSKLLSRKKRESLFGLINSVAAASAVAFETPQAIDSINILEASKKAMQKALRLLQVEVSHVLVDGNQKIPTRIPQTTIVRGDGKSLSIAAASIVAKVTRDWYMTAIDNRWPEYHFASNMGYGTSEHLGALKRFGACPIHRLSYRPVAATLP